MLLSAELLRLLPVGFYVTNGDGIAVGRIEENVWECSVSGLRKRNFETPEKAAQYVEDARTF